MSIALLELFLQRIDEMPANTSFSLFDVCDPDFAALCWQYIQQLDNGQHRRVSDNAIFVSNRNQTRFMWQKEEEAVHVYQLR